MVWYAYEVDTRVIVKESENFDDLSEYCGVDEYGITESPAFGMIDGLIYRDERYFMNPNTGSIDTLDGWFPYTEKDGLIEVVRDKDGHWTEKE